jgi:hypothetical protein
MNEEVENLWNSHVGNGRRSVTSPFGIIAENLSPLPKRVSDFYQFLQEIVGLK